MLRMVLMMVVKIMRGRKFYSPTIMLNVMNMLKSLLLSVDL